MDLTEVEIIKIAGIVGISHFLLAILFTIELKLIPFYSMLVKIFWFLIIWILPIIGVFLFHLFARSGWRKIELH